MLPLSFAITAHDRSESAYLPPSHALSARAALPLSGGGGFLGACCRGRGPPGVSRATLPPCPLAPAALNPNALLVAGASPLALLFSLNPFRADYSAGRGHRPRGLRRPREGAGSDEHAPLLLHHLCPAPRRPT